MPAIQPAATTSTSGRVLAEADELRRKAALNREKNQTLFGGAVGPDALGGSKGPGGQGAPLAGGQPLKSLLG